MPLSSSSASPSGASDLTSGDDDPSAEHFDLRDALAMLARESTDCDDDDALPPSVEDAIAAVYDAVTRDEARTAAGMTATTTHNNSDSTLQDATRTRRARVSPTTSSTSRPRKSATVHNDDDRSSTTSGNVSDDEMRALAATAAASTDPNALKRARRSEIEKKSRQRRQVRRCIRWFIR